MKNANLHKAKKEKNDEFYTMMSDIEKELVHYRHHFKGKTVYCNCDDPFESNFFKYFVLNFNFLGLKKLITTCFDGSKMAQTELTLFDMGQDDVKRTAYKVEITSVPDPITDVYGWLKGDKVVERLGGNGDFRSAECIELLQQADIVVTNPPFSLFREYVAQLMQYEKKFLILGSQNAITYKEVFPLIKDDCIWLGVNHGSKEFVKPNGDRQKFGNICWFTNLTHNKRNEPLILTEHYTPERYPKYDNYDAINVDKVCEIPMDYDGVMGVPITFLDSYCPEQFEIVAFRKGDDGKDLVFSRAEEVIFNEMIISKLRGGARCSLTSECLSDDDRTHRDIPSTDLRWHTQRICQWERNVQENPCQDKEPIDVIFPISTNLKNGMINDYTINGKKGYCRLLIRTKQQHNEDNTKCN